MNLPDQREADRPIGSNLLGLIELRRGREGDFDYIAHCQLSGCLSEGQRGFFRFRLTSSKEEDAEANDDYSQIPANRKKLGVDSKIFSQMINRSAAF
jgi:hypothetical protein